MKFRVFGLLTPAFPRQGDEVRQIKEDAVDDYITGFHAKEGLFFERQEDGSVAVKIATYPGKPEVERIVVLDADAWASVVSVVSASGENGPRWRLAKALHDS